MGVNVLLAKPSVTSVSSKSWWSRPINGKKERGWAAGARPGQTQAEALVFGAGSAWPAAPGLVRPPRPSTGNVARSLLPTASRGDVAEQRLLGRAQGDLCEKGVYISARRPTGLGWPVYTMRSPVTKTVNSKTEQSLLPKTGLRKAHFPPPKWYRKGVEVEVSWLKHVGRNDAGDL